MVEPGQIWATEAFGEQFLQRPSLWRTAAVPTPNADGHFNARKPGSQDADL